MKDVQKMQAWLGLIGAVLSIAGVIVGCTLWFSHKFTELGDKVVAVRNDEDTRIAKIESAIKVLVSDQPVQMKQLVHELMAEQKTVGKPQAPNTYSGPVVVARSRTATAVAGSSADAAATPKKPEKPDKEKY